VGEVFPIVRGVAYFSPMKKRMAIIASVLSLALLAPVSADGVEFGQDATGDPNAVRMNGGGSAFLYSDRLVFTAAHNFDGSENWPNLGFVNAPGVLSTSDQKKYNIHKILKAPTYRARLGADNTRIDDFAILILRESIPMQNKVEVASPADIESFIREKAPVEMVGYGFQNEAQRSETQAWKDRAPRKMTSVLVSGEDLRKYYSTHAGSLQPNQTILDFGIPNSEKTGSNCDGDSGSGFFVQKNNVRYYLGAAGGSQAGITNCYGDRYGDQTRWRSIGGMSGITATNKFLALIKEAEDFVANEKRLEAMQEAARVAAELKAKQEADERARVEAELRAKLEAEEKIAAEAAAKALADAALLAATKKSQDLAKKQNVGKSCSKLKSVKAVSGVKFICVKKGKKLVWAAQ
jgi:hypothetical protein